VGVTSDVGDSPPLAQIRGIVPVRGGDGGVVDGRHTRMLDGFLSEFSGEKEKSKDKGKKKLTRKQGEEDSPL